MASITHITDYAARVVNRMIEQFKNTVGLKGLLTGFAAQAQQIEDALFTLLSTRSLFDAQGVVLDQIGSILGAKREGLSDADYISRLQAQILINRRSGEIETLIAITALLYPNALVRLIEYTATTHIYVEQIITDYATALRTANILRLAKAGGVALRLIWQPADDTLSFCFAAGPGLGFGNSADASVGGQLVGSA